MRKIPLARILAGLMLAAAGQAMAADADLAAGLDRLKLNQLQVLGTHNSYAMPADRHVLDLAGPNFGHLHDLLPKLPEAARALFLEEHPNDVDLADGLSYEHPGLAAQLDEGVRSLEIDVNPDPEGGAYLDPAGYRLLREQGVSDLLPFDKTGLDKPGYKVFHIADVDFRSHCPTFELCLSQIRGWSDAHPRHVPIFIMLEAKVDGLSLLPGGTPDIPFDAKSFDDLDREIFSVLGRGRLITPDDVRGSYPTLNKAIRAGNWPTVKEARGKIMIFMITASGAGGTQAYLDGHPSLTGRAAFLRANPGEDHAAVLMFDNAVTRGDEIRRYVKEGYIIRTRTDIETFEAKTNDMSRADAAFASGAQIVTTDFEHPGNRYGTDYVVRLPGGGVARCSPVFGEACHD